MISAIEELMKPASDDDLRKFSNGTSGIQWYRNIAAELLRRREADRWVREICESPKHRTYHTLLQMCRLLDEIHKLIPPEAQS